DGLPEVLAEKVSLLPELLKVTKAENTHLSYKRGFNRWRRWGYANGLSSGDALPAKAFQSPEETIGVAAFIVAYEEGLSTLIGVASFIVAYEEGLCRSIAYEEGLVPAYSMPGVVSSALTDRQTYWFTAVIAHDDLYGHDNDENDVYNDAVVAIVVDDVVVVVIVNDDDDDKKSNTEHT
ncbi:hypothetical protein DPMN_022817, partial [Dreissena polymorpha]